MRLFIGISLLFFASFTRAQSGEMGMLFGASNYHGDLAENIVLSESHFSAGVFYRINFNEFWSYRPTVSYMKISGTDKNFEEYHLRNLSFYSTIWEVANNIEFNYQPFSSRAYHKHSTFYAFAGIAAFYHNPKTEMNNKTYNLHDYRTENQDTDGKYSLFQLSIPFGVGYKHAVTPNFLIGVELGWRKVFMDYLDDVSTVYPDLEELRKTRGEEASLLSDRSWEVSDNGSSLASQGKMRGDPNLNDWYVQACFTISYRFTPIKCWAE